jgi:hypothetical protein
MHWMSATGLAPCLVLLAVLAAAAPGNSLAAGVDLWDPEPIASAAKPLCRADITPVEGLPSRELLLLSFEGGVYRVRAGDEEFEVHEAEIRSITFHPLKTRRRGPAARDIQPTERLGRRGRPEPEPDRAARLGFLRDVLRRQAEVRRKLEGLKRKGELDAHIARREAKLVAASSPEEATKVLIELAMAGRINGAPLGTEEWNRLIGSIADPAVRKEANARRSQLIRMLDRMLDEPRGGRRRGRFGPRRGTD